MPNPVDSPTTLQSSGTPSKLYFTVDLVENHEMASKWPDFPFDYLESRREAIHDQICRNDMNVSEVHKWLLNRGRWISKEQLEDALRGWIDEDPLDWHDMPDLELYTSRQEHAIDDLLEEYINETEYDYDGQEDYIDLRGDSSRTDKSKADYSDVNEYDNRGRQFDRRDKYDARNYDLDQSVERGRRKEAKPVVQRMSGPGLGQTMSSRYVPGLEIPRIARSMPVLPDATSNRRTLNFFGSLLKPDSPWANPDTSLPQVPRDPSRSLRVDMLKAYPVNENRGPNTALSYAHGGGSGGVYDWLRDEELEARDKPSNQVQLAKQENDDNEYDWEIFMTAVKQST